MTFESNYAIAIAALIDWLRKSRDNLKPKPKQLLRPITTGAGSAMNQSQFLAITCNSLEAREKSRVHGVIGFGFASHWLKNWRESLKPITKLSNRNHGITFDSHLKTALMVHSIEQRTFCIAENAVQQPDGKRHAYPSLISKKKKKTGSSNLLFSLQQN